MGNGKHQKSRWVVPAMTWTLIILALLGMTVGGVAAYLSMSAGSVENTFTEETEVQPTIAETMKDNVKSNVSVNVGNPGYAVYVRAAVVVTWRDAAGNVLAQTPAESDYTIVYNENDWFTDGDFWYCKTMVSSSDGETDGLSPVLIRSCTPTASKGDYHLHVEIVAQTIQALGTTDEAVDSEGNPVPTVPAVTDAWGVYVQADKTLSQTPPA